MFTLINSSNYQKMKWKNSRGETSEIARFPGEDPYLWRLSMAPVIENGQFSLFPGYDRYITLVEGLGLKLKTNVVYIGDVLKFSGDEEISGELVDGKIVDLNLIFKRDQVKAKFEVLKYLIEPVPLTINGKTALIFVISGQIKVFNPKLKFIVEEKDTLRIKNESFIIQENRPNSLCVLIEID